MNPFEKFFTEVFAIPGAHIVAKADCVEVFSPDYLQPFLTLQHNGSAWVVTGRTIHPKVLIACLELQRYLNGGLK